MIDKGFPLSDLFINPGIVSFQTKAIYGFLPQYTPHGTRIHPGDLPLYQRKRGKQRYQKRTKGDAAPCQ